MIEAHMTVPFACWLPYHARQFLETWPVPSPATDYGSLMSLVGETDRLRHLGVRITAGVVGTPEVSTVLRMIWRNKKESFGQGNKQNAIPSLQQLVTQAHVVIFCDSSEEVGQGETLEARVVRALRYPETVTRSGGWSLGSSSDLINDAWLRTEEVPMSKSCSTFLLDPEGDLTLPVWVDHVGQKGTRHAVGRLASIMDRPDVRLIPRIERPIAA